MRNFILCFISGTLLLTAASCSAHSPSKPENGRLSGTGEAYQSNKPGIRDSDSLSKEELTNIYSQAITDYLKAVYQKDKTVFDTLYFGKRKLGQADDFPDIELPETIGHTHIRLIDPSVGKKLQAEKKSRVYINMIGWADKKQAEFILVAFSNGFEHTFDCYLNYHHLNDQETFVLEKSRIEVLIYDSKGKPEHYAVYVDGKYTGDKATR